MAKWQNNAKLHFELLEPSAVDKLSLAEGVFCPFRQSELVEPEGCHESTMRPLCVTAPWKRRVEFIDENGGGPGVRLRKRQRAKQPK